MAQHSQGGGKYRHPKRSGKRVGGRNCEALPSGGVMALGSALTDKLKKMGDYGRVRFNPPMRRPSTKKA